MHYITSPFACLLLQFKIEQKLFCWLFNLTCMYFYSKWRMDDFLICVYYEWAAVAFCPGSNDPAIGRAPGDHMFGNWGQSNNFTRTWIIWKGSGQLIRRLEVSCCKHSPFVENGKNIQLISVLLRLYGTMLLVLYICVSGSELSCDLVTGRQLWKAG